jgi:hypothetical protein
MRRALATARQRGERSREGTTGCATVRKLTGDGSLFYGPLKGPRAHQRLCVSAAARDHFPCAAAGERCCVEHSACAMCDPGAEI